jgi:flagellar assembly factor FliW
MSEQGGPEGSKIIIRSTRFGNLEVPASSIIEFPSGLIGFPSAQRFVMFEHKPPFSWLHSADDPNLAFVVVDGFEFGPDLTFKPPIGDKDIDLKEGDEYAILVIVTVRPDPRQTTANLKAPLFVNLKNRKGVQIIYDDPRLTTRYALWLESDNAAQGGESGPTPAAPASEKEKK